MLELTGDNRAEAAKRPGISRQSLYTRMANLDIGQRRISGHACPGALTLSLPRCRQSVEDLRQQSSAPEERRKHRRASGPAPARVGFRRSTEAAPVSARARDRS